MLVKESSWSDVVVPKARDLIATGAVTILVNTPNYIQSHVIGYGTDNDDIPDEHEVEIWRNDPKNPEAIASWACDCRWGQVSWGRTRKFKRFNGRPCSHVMATLWQSRSTPQDLSEMQPGYQVPRGQARPTEPGMQAPTPEQMQMQIPGLEGEGPAITPTPTPEEGPLAIPPTPFHEKVPQTPERQREQLYLWDLTAVPGQETPAQFMPIPPEQRTQTLQMPGAFSSVQASEIPLIRSVEIPRFKIIYSDFTYTAADEFETAVQDLLNKGRTPVVLLLRPVELEARGGKQPIPEAQPHSFNQENTPQYHVMDLGWHPELGQRVNADTPTAGAPEWRGQSQVAKAGKHAIILSLEPALKWAFISVPLHLSGPLHPHSLEGYVSYQDLKLLPNARDPYQAGY